MNCLRIGINLFKDKYNLYTKIDSLCLMEKDSYIIYKIIINNNTKNKPTEVGELKTKYIINIINKYIRKSYDGFYIYICDNDENTWLFCIRNK